MTHPPMLVPTLELVGVRPQRTYEIKGTDFRIGRLDSLDLFLDDIRVSRPHARIQLRPDGGYELVDLKSQNGTQLNGKKLIPWQPKRLRDGDMITIVEYELVFHHPGSVVHQTEEDGTTVLGTLEDLSSDNLVKRSAHPAASFKAILEVSRALGGGRDLGEVLGRALDGLMGVFPRAERGIIVIAEPDGRLKRAAFRQKGGTASAPVLSRTIGDRVLGAGTAVLIEDIAADPVLSTQNSLAPFVRSAICVPLSSHEGKPIGIIQLDRLAGSDHFQEQDLELLAALAVPIGVAVENDRLVKERTALTVAREIQFSLLPRVQPQIPGYQFWECYRPAQEVGGDLYDYIPVEQAATAENTERCWAVTLGDVAGKGMPAALVMAGICPEVRHLVRAGVPPGDVLGRVNRHVYDHGVAGWFVTLLISLIDPRTHVLTLVAAGHAPSLIRRAGGQVEEIASAEGGPPLGVVREATYRPGSFLLGPGDVVVHYSDGVTDVMNRSGQCFTRERLHDVLAEAPASVSAVGEAILAAVCDHFTGRSQFDDITILCFGHDLV
jgi:serine phosphatase RsbU (regulator of sigma subunit)